MAMVKYEPNRNIVPFSSAISRVFDEFFPSVFGSESTIPTVTWRPSVDIIEHDDKVLIRADMPGLEKSDIKVVVNDGLLTIEGSRREERDEKSKGFVRTERFVGNFARSFNLPSWADASKIDANYKNGVLEVTIPKTETARPKEIDIKIG
ncbi:MAG: Hsp20/alpha crystallin family protein [Candidatus Zixiibacteriota bacterium]